MKKGKKEAPGPLQAVSARLRERLTQGDVLRAEVARATGLSESSLSRFVHKGTGLSMTSIDKLARYFGLSLTDATGVSTI